MLEKLTDAVWKMKRPKQYREHTEEELMKEYDVMREELARLSQHSEYTGEELLAFLEQNQDLITAVEVVEKQKMDALLSKKK